MAFSSRFWHLFAFFGMLQFQNVETEISAEIPLPCQFENTPCLWFWNRNKDSGLFWNFLAIFGTFLAFFGILKYQNVKIEIEA